MMLDEYNNRLILRRDGIKTAERLLNWDNRELKTCSIGGGEKGSPFGELLKGDWSSMDYKPPEERKKRANGAWQYM